jgi:hypothetical protein
MSNKMSDVVNNILDQILNIDSLDYVPIRVTVGKFFYKFERENGKISVIDIKTDKTIKTITFSPEQFIKLGIYSTPCTQMVIAYINKFKIRFSSRILDSLIEDAMNLKKEVKKQEHTHVHHRLQDIYLSLIQQGVPDYNYIKSTRTLYNFEMRGFFCEVFTEVLSGDISLCLECRDKTLKLLFKGMYQDELLKRNIGVHFSSGEKIDCKNRDIYSCISSSTEGITIVNR